MLVQALATHPGVTPGRHYVAAGMMTNTAGLWFFVLDDDSIPRAIPADVCKRHTTTMPDSWFVGTWIADGNLDDHAALHGASTVWGYPELVFDSTHWGLVDDYNHKAVEMFSAYHAELVRWYDSSGLLTAASGLNESTAPASEANRQEPS